MGALKEAVCATLHIISISRTAAKVFMRGGPWPGSIASCIAQNSMPKTAEFMIAPLLARPPTTYLSGQNSSMPEGHFRFPRQYSARRSEEHTSELQSLMRISYAVFCL